jgi:hypothetical protein
MLDWGSEDVLADTITIVKPCLELGTTATAYEPYIEPTTYTANSDGTINGIKSISPNMTLLTNNSGVVINAHYYKDPDIVISNLTQAVALSGGEG